MAQQLAPRMTTPSVCSQFPYAEFLPLKSFAPAETFCSLYLAQSKLPPISGCPKGNALCSILSRLSQCDRDFISTVCQCIESGSTTTISVPKSTTPSTTKTTAKSSSSSKTANSQSSSAKSTTTESATSKTSSVGSSVLSTPTEPATSKTFSVGSSLMSIPTESATSTTSSVITPSCVAPVLNPSCTTVTTPDGFPYFQYFSGQYVVENTTNPGNDDPADYPPVTTDYLGTLDMCDAAQLCADNAEATPGEYQSFDLHYLCSTAMWECVQYYDPSDDPSYFDVPDNDALYTFGFEGCC